MDRDLTEKNQSSDRIPEANSEFFNVCPNCKILKQKLQWYKKHAGFLYDESTHQMIRIIMYERRLLVKLAEMSFKKLTKYRETVQDLQMSSNMTEILLKDLVDFAQIQSGTFHLNEDYFDLMELVRNSLKTLKWNADKREVSLEGPVLKLDGDAVFFKQLFGDSLRYLQIINNFISNSIKFTSRLGTVQILV